MKTVLIMKMLILISVCFVHYDARVVSKVILKIPLSKKHFNVAKFSRIRIV